MIQNISNLNSTSLLLCV